MPESTHDNARWLAAAQAGSHEALGQALESCRAYLLLVANREVDGRLQAKGKDPSDLVQETFLEAQRDFARFHGDSGEEFRAWLRQILLHNVANFARRYRDTDKRRVSREVPIGGDDSTAGGLPPLAGDTPTPSTEFAAAERMAAVDAALARLPDDYRHVIELRNRDDRPFAEIAAELGRTENAVRKLWFRAVAQLKQELDAAE